VNGGVRWLACLSLLVTAWSAAARPLRETTIFAGGCFWTMEDKFSRVPGVIDVVAGVTGGRERPTESSFAAGGTGHLEAVAVIYDGSKVSYRQLVDRFWRMIDPTDAGGQACDRGPSYAAAVFATPAQRSAADASRRAVVAALRGARVVTPIRAASAFWPAPASHQDYARLHAERYARYYSGCGRAERLRAIWARADVTK